MNTYRYTLHGTAAAGQTWQTEGTFKLAEGDFPKASFEAMRDAFPKLTNGNAVFGHPGKGCSGPYKATKLTVELILDA